MARQAGPTYFVNETAEQVTARTRAASIARWAKPGARDKPSPLKGKTITPREIVVCEMCLIEFEAEVRLHRRFCSIACYCKTEESRNAKRNAGKSNLGRKWGSYSPEHCQSISEGRRRHVAESIDCTCGACLPHRKKPTKIELILKAHLENIYPGEEVKSYQKFGSYSVDAYIPNLHLAFEADGEYWHIIGKGRDEVRDKFLQDKFDLPVIRIWGQELLAMERRFHYLQIA